MDISTILSLLLVAAAVLVPVLMAVAAFFILGRVFYKVPGPDEALVITGRGARPTKEFQEQLAAERAAAESKDSDGPVVVASKIEPDPEFKIIVGTGSWLKPGQRMERLSLAAQQADVSLRDVPTVQGIPLHTSATVLYKVGDSYSATARAARRFAGNNDWTKMVADVLEGQLRSVIGTMTVEDIWRDRDRLATKVSETSAEELARLGLQIETFQLKPIEDPSGYIANLAAQPQAEAERNARITRAENEQQAAQREAETQTETEQSLAAAKIAQAEARKEADRVEAEANQAKPLAEAKAQQEVILEKTRNAELEKDLNRRNLEATVYQEADAQKYAQVVNAQAQSETAVIQAEAQAKATQVAADARKEAAAANAEADAVATERQAQANAAAALAAAQADSDSTKLRAEAAEAEGRAQAAADEARGLAQAKVTLEQGKAVGEAERLKAEAMSANKDAVVELELVRQLPAALAANAQAFARVNNITVMDGVEGFQDSISGVLQQGLTSLPAILHALKGTGLSAVSDSFPSFERPIEVAVGVLGGPDGPEKDEQLKALADKFGSAIADGVEKSTKGVTVKGSSAGLADVSDAFSKAAVDIDTTIPGSSVDPAAVFNGVTGGIEQAQQFVDQAGEVAGQAQEFLHANQDTIDQLAAAGGKVRRRTR
jgi:uncharacterized membrane protein YqiK